MAQAALAQLLIAAPLPFEATSESWINYVERLEAFFEANDGTLDSKKLVSPNLCPEPRDLRSSIELVGTEQAEG